MVQILQKRAPALTIRAGHLARELILQQGLQPEQVDIVPGAAGAQKASGSKDWIRRFLVSFFHVHLSVELWWVLRLAAGVLPVWLHMEFNREPNVWVSCIPTSIFIKK